MASNFGSALHYPHSDNFTVWDQKCQQVQSSCRIEPATAEDVAAVLRVLVNNWCTFAVKSGGHTWIKAASNSIGGVTVDLKRINAVELSDDRKTTRVGTGAVWGDVYRTLEPHDLSVIGGRVDDVGVGGLVLGGGVSFLSGRHGWAADNVLEYEVCTVFLGGFFCNITLTGPKVVLPNTTIVTATEDSNPDIYFALRGGGNNFGIVTRFTLNTVSQGKLYGGQKFYSIDKMDALIDASEELMLSNDPDLAFWTGIIYMAAQNTTMGLSQEMYTKPVENPPVYSDLDAVEPFGSTMRTNYMSNFSMELKTGTPFGKRYAKRGIQTSSKPNRVLIVFLLAVTSWPR